jgi:hypothetical protein
MNMRAPVGAPAQSPESDSTGRRRALAIALCLFILLFAMYMVTYCGVVASTDELGLLSGVDSLVRRGDLSMDQIAWYGYTIGTFEPAQIVLGSILYRIALALPGFGALQTTYLLNVLVTALTGVLVFLYVRRLGYRYAVAGGAALIYGLDTMAWVYSKVFFREPLAGLALLATAYFLLGLRPTSAGGATGRQRLVYGVLAATAYGLAITTKETMLVALPILLAMGAWYLVERIGPQRPPARQQLGLVLFTALVSATVIGLILLYNQSVLGYLAVGSRRVPEMISSFFTLTPDTWNAMLQMPLSPGKGLFTHSPILLLSLFAIPLLWHRRRYSEFVLPFLLVFAFMRAYSTAPWIWWGGLNWGPRYFVPLLPFLTIALAPVLQYLLQRGSRALWVGFVAAAAVSLVVQVGGLAVNLELFANQLTAIREDAPWTLAITDPRYSEIIGHLRLLKPENLDFAWVRYWDGQISFDWLIPFLCAICVAGAVIGLLRLRRAAPTSRGLAILLVGAVLAPTLLAGTALPRFYDDPRYRREKEWYPLMDTLRSQERDGDVLILNVPTHTTFFLNYNRAKLPWYGLSKETWPLRQDARLATLLTKFDRIWLATEFFPESDQFRGIERWLDEHAYKVSDQQFGYPARLMLFVTGSEPTPDLLTSGTLARFGQRMELLAAQVPTGTTRSGEVLPLTLLWRSIGKIEVDYTVTIRLWDAEGRIVLQIDRQPVDGFRPTSTWASGEVIRDNYALALPEGLPKGAYRIAVGVYQWPTLQRLSLSAPDTLRLSEADLVLLGYLGVGVPGAPALPYPILP